MTVQQDSKTSIEIEALTALRSEAAMLRLRPSLIKANQAGGYISSFKGRGMEYEESRPYAMGDDVRAIDWRVTARTGEVYTKLYREERERAVWLVVDLSDSMHFASNGQFKSVLAAKLAALIGFAAVKHGDLIGALVFNGQKIIEVKPKRGLSALVRVFAQLKQLDQLSNGRKTLYDALEQLQNLARPGSLVFVMSDFQVKCEQFQQVVRYMAKHIDFVLLNTIDRLEKELPHGKNLWLSRGESVWKLNTSTQARASYEQRFHQHQACLEETSLIHGVSFINAWTHITPIEILKQVLR